MKKTVKISKHIHSCLASASSNDVWLNVFLPFEELDFTPEQDIVIESKKYRFLNGETISKISGDNKFMAIYLESDKTFYNKGDFRTEWHKTDEFKILIGGYIVNGWGRVYNKEYDEWEKREEKREEKKSKKNGIVLWHSYDNLKKQPLSVYQGGFSDEVFNTPKLQSYISNHACFGWIGDSGARRKEHDILIEKGLRERGLTADQMYNWISSSDGRHFADSLCGYPLKEQLKKIDKYLNHIYNCCLIYGDETHQGTFESTKEIASKLEEKGLLLPTN